MSANRRLGIPTGGSPQRPSHRDLRPVDTASENQARRVVPLLLRMRLAHTGRTRMAVLVGNEFASQATARHPSDDGFHCGYGVVPRLALRSGLPCSASSSTCVTGRSLVCISLVPMALMSRASVDREASIPRNWSDVSLLLKPSSTAAQQSSGADSRSEVATRAGRLIRDRRRQINVSDLRRIVENHIQAVWPLPKLQFRLVVQRCGVP